MTVKCHSVGVAGVPIWNCDPTKSLHTDLRQAQDRYAYIYYYQGWDNLDIDCSLQPLLIIQMTISLED